MSEQKDTKIGRIARFLPERHFGFVVDQSTGEEYFFHEMNVSGSPVKGSQATFEIGSFRGKPTATNLVINKA